ncbi:peptide deformylase [Brachybacterium sp. EF45031]|uniref:peptide deformylase n=1 Tax=Brachybacterium sillae TaxID=2810536 RepID=UPI00217DB039|nr:peptide deformylase [Brachybacterium sillae]MCS6712270.1 peptide deformylase [Brachybacterium sillae]
MTVLPITVIGHPVLEKRAKRVKHVTDDLRTLVADMFETNDAADGAGLAAPQVGRSLRLFVVSCPDVHGVDHRTEVINPVLERFGPLEMDEEYVEGCLSVPGLGRPTARFRGARVRGTDLEGREIVLEDEGGILARALQHETDHLEGSLYLARLAPMPRREILDEASARGWRRRGITTWDPTVQAADEV